VPSPKLDAHHRCSRYLQAVYALVLALLVFTLFWLWGGLTISAVILALTLWCAWEMWRQLRFLKTLERIQVSQGKMALVVRGEKIVVARVGQSVVSEFIVTISCHVAGKKHRWFKPLMHLVLLPDSVSRDDHRALRVLLRTGKL